VAEPGMELRAGATRSPGTRDRRLGSGRAEYGPPDQITGGLPRIGPRRQIDRRPVSGAATLTRLAPLPTSVPPKTRCCWPARHLAGQGGPTGGVDPDADLAGRHATLESLQTSWRGYQGRTGIRAPPRRSWSRPWASPRRAVSAAERNEVGLDPFVVYGVAAGGASAVRPVDQGRRVDARRQGVGARRITIRTELSGTGAAMIAQAHGDHPRSGRAISDPGPTTRQRHPRFFQLWWRPLQ